MTPPAPFITSADVQASLQATLAHLDTHRVLAYPTETVYGLGGTIAPDSVNALVTLKHRTPDKPILLLIAGVEMLAPLDLHLSPHASTLAAAFWPGPLTLVLPEGKRPLPTPLRNAEGGVAIRWTPHQGLTHLIRAIGAPLTSTSANQPGQPPAQSATDVMNDWPDAIASGLIRVLDGGTLAPSPPSTVVDCMGPAPRILRLGATPLSALREVLPAIVP